MAAPFDKEILSARSARRARLIKTAVAGVAFLVPFSVIFAYTFAYQISVSSPGYSPKFQLKVSSGSALKIGRDRVFLPFQDAVVTVSASGFLDESVYLSTNRGTRKIAVELQPASVPVILRPSENLLEPVWYIDGVALSSNPTPNLNLKPGRYEITLSSRSHRTETKNLEVELGVSIDEIIPVHAASSNYNIRSEPTGADIYLDNEKIGVSPAAGSIKAGKRQIRIQKKGYDPIFEEIEIRNDQGTFSRLHHLSEAQRFISASYKPTNGRVFVDGQKVPQSPKLAVSYWKEGKVRYEADGYVGEEISVDSRTNSISFSLQPEYGHLSLTSEPESEITVNGEKRGTTPLKLDLLATRHEILFKKEGYATERITLDVFPTNKFSHHAILQTIAAKRLADSKKNYTNKANIQLVRFVPTRFPMGAPRSQRGQRANELQRTVDFKRTFYISKHEITQAQYSEFDKRKAKVNEPATNITWNEAALFCNWLSRLDGLESFYKEDSGRIIGVDSNALGFRLPTEAEWEFVARHGGKHAPSIFVWGSDYKVPDGAGNLADVSAKAIVKMYLADFEDHHEELAPVGGFPLEPSGVHDMVGNVSEWVHDVYSIQVPKRDRVYVDYLGPIHGSGHVVKGSNYKSATWTELRAAYRQGVEGGQEELGFRVARYIN